MFWGLVRLVIEVLQYFVDSGQDSSNQYVFENYMSEINATSLKD